MKTELQFQFIETNGIKLHVARAGNLEDPLVIFLHGFPEFWISFRRQVDALIAAGYQVMLPDQRGFNLSDKPWRIGSYKLDKMAADVIGLIDHAGKDKAYVVGHDWGAAVTWFLGSSYPDRLHKIITLNVPHNSIFRKYMFTNKEQRKKSQYMYDFQWPIVPQIALRRKDFKNLVKTIQKSSVKGTFSDADMEEYKSAWKQRRAIPCMLNWYRASFRRKLKMPNRQVTIPNLIIWGEKDNFLMKEMAEASLKYCDQGKLEYIEDATHWVQHEKPELVSKLIVDFLLD
ncbi:MAG: alpha/beta hydrolase [Candidatus Heimdallarchaeota archaeon]|nr:alpha/beta hydrolase [Candidatus Heimdallarchaeota archaeon]